MVTVGVNAVGVEQRLAEGRLACPDCGARLAGWGHARARVLRSPDGPVWTRPRRSRCTGCGVTHVLLPLVALLRRADTAAVIGAALVAKVTGLGWRRIAVLVGRPASTVRGWLRRFAGRVEELRAWFTVWLRAVEPDPVMPEPAGSGWADALAAITAVGRAVVKRFVVPAVSPWEVAVAISNGRLLTLGWPPEWINTSCP